MLPYPKFKGCIECCCNYIVSQKQFDKTFHRILLCTFACILPPKDSFTIISNFLYTPFVSVIGQCKGGDLHGSISLQEEVLFSGISAKDKHQITLPGCKQC